jgi:hypothetical protein
LRQSQKRNPVYELAGPRVYSYEELLRTIARIAGLRPVLMRMPFAFWDALAGIAEMLPRPSLTRNQVELMQIDTTASKSLPGFHSQTESLVTVTTPIASPALGSRGGAPGERTHCKQTFELWRDARRPFGQHKNVELACHGCWFVTLIGVFRGGIRSRGAELVNEGLATPFGDFSVFQHRGCESANH